MTLNERNNLTAIIEDLLDGVYNGLFPIAEIHSIVKNLIDLNFRVKSELCISLPEHLFNFAKEWGMYKND